VITGLAAKRLGRRRSRDPASCDLGLRARKLLLERRVGSLEVVASDSGGRHAPSAFEAIVAGQGEYSGIA
jgi:hypothetical protein